MFLIFRSRFSDYMWERQVACGLIADSFKNQGRGAAVFLGYQIKQTERAYGE